MVLTKQDFFIKAGFLVAAVAASNLRWLIALNPDREALFYLGSLLAVVTYVPIIAVIPGALFGVAALAMGKRTWDHYRACFLMGLYFVALWLVYFNITKIADIPRPPTPDGGGGLYWYVAYGYAFIYSLPGVDLRQTQQEIDREKARRQQIAQRPGINRWLLVGGCSLILFTLLKVLTDVGFNIVIGASAVCAFAIGLGLLVSDAFHGRLRLWKIALPSSSHARFKQSKTLDWSAMSLALINSKNWSALLRLTDDWLAAERGNHECWAAKGFAHEMLGDVHKAISAYQVLLKCRYDETVAKRIDDLVEERARKRQEQKAEGERPWGQRAHDSNSKSSNTRGARSQNSTQLDHYYGILEIQPGAPINEVKAAYKRRMQQYHPDKVASLGKELRDLAEAKTKEINAAYRAIVDTRDA